MSQGNVMLSGQASFPTPDTMIFVLGSEALPGAGSLATGVLTVLSAGV